QRRQLAHAAPEPSGGARGQQGQNYKDVVAGHARVSLMGWKTPSVAVLGDSLDRLGQARDDGQGDVALLHLAIGLWRREGALEAQLLRLAQASLGAADGAHLARQADLAENDAA